MFTIVSSTDPEFLSEYMPANLLFRYEDKQAVMNENTLAGRLQRLVEMLRRECQVMKIEKEIADKVNESMDKNQRDYYLHEQLHVISDELGEGDDTHAEADEYRRKITALHLAEDSEKSCSRKWTACPRCRAPIRKPPLSAPIWTPAWTCRGTAIPRMIWTSTVPSRSWTATTTA